MELNEEPVMREVARQCSPGQALCLEKGNVFYLRVHPGEPATRSAHAVSKGLCG